MLKPSKLIKFGGFKGFTKTFSNFSQLTPFFYCLQKCFCLVTIFLSGNSEVQMERKIIDLENGH